MKRFLFVITLIFIAPQILALSEQHDVNPTDTESELHDVKPADTQSEQHDVNLSDEADEFKPADAD
ncbi:MAG: hypothetical protein E2O57_01255 [Gammaproteobacteria bacterium]|nr:MAG: hypothetical protein E2O57_01255 [Gammaproteobacteria bacterium]